jgi:hypothetical protein
MRGTREQIFARLRLGRRLRLTIISSKLIVGIFVARRDDAGRRSVTGQILLGDFEHPIPPAQRSWWPTLRAQTVSDLVDLLRAHLAFG